MLMLRRAVVVLHYAPPLNLVVAVLADKALYGLCPFSLNAIVKFFSTVVFHGM